MSEGILIELEFFSRAFLWGVLMTSCYDVIRIFRRIVRHGAAAVAIEDILYWIACAVCIFRMLYVENSGVIRGFAIGAVILGMAAYLQVMRVLKKIGKKLQRTEKGD